MLILWDLLRHSFDLINDQFFKCLCELKQIVYSDLRDRISYVWWLKPSNGCKICCCCCWGFLHYCIFFCMICIFWKGYDKIFNPEFLFITSFLLFCQLILYIFWRFIVGYIYIYDECILSIYCSFLKVWNIFPCVLLFLVFVFLGFFLP